MRVHLQLGEDVERDESARFMTVPFSAQKLWVCVDLSATVVCKSLKRWFVAYAKNPGIIVSARFSVALNKCVTQETLAKVAQLPCQLRQSENINPDVEDHDVSLIKESRLSRIKFRIRIRAKTPCNIDLNPLR